MIVMFSKTPINELAQSISEMPDKLLYRSDEIASVIKSAAPYLIVFFLLSILLTEGMVFFFAKSVSYNFIRLVRLGAEEKRLNSSYNRAAYGVGLGCIIAALIFSVIVLCIIGVSKTAAAYVAFVYLGVLLTLICAVNANKKRLWRTA